METDLVEYRILSLLRSREAYLKYSNVIREHLFESRYTKYIYKLLVYYHKQTKSKMIAPLSSLFALVNIKVKENEAEKYKDIIRKIKAHPLSDASISENIVKAFAQKQILKLTIMDAIQALDKDDKIDIPALRSRLDEAMLVEHADLLDDAYDYFTSPMKRLEEDRNEPRIGTLLDPRLDFAMRGGLAGGELGIVIGPTSTGKTTILINLCYNAIKQGKKVLYVTLEISGRRLAGRFDQLFTKRPIEEILANPNLVSLATRKLSKDGGGLKIKDYTANKMSAENLATYMERISKDFPIDMVIVDQIDLMYSTKEQKERRYELSSIVIALRRLAASYKIPIWTASQATRAAGASGQTTLWDIAEDIGKANWADVILTLSQSPEDKEERKLYLNLAKNRIGEGNPSIPLNINYSIMHVKGSYNGKGK